MSPTERYTRGTIDARRDGTLTISAPPFPSLADIPVRWRARYLASSPLTSATDRCSAYASLLVFLVALDVTWHEFWAERLKRNYTGVREDAEMWGGVMVANTNKINWNHFTGSFCWLSDGQGWPVCHWK